MHPDYHCDFCKPVDDLAWNAWGEAHLDVIRSLQRRSRELYAGQKLDGERFCEFIRRKTEEFVVKAGVDMLKVDWRKK